MSLSNRKDAEVCFRIFPCFVVIEDSKNKLIYITEIQEGRSSLLEYEEINEIPCSDTSMGIKIVGKYPKETVESELRDQWVELCHYKVPLRKLTWVGGKIDLRLDPNMGILEFSLFNIPIFEFEDGFYMLPGHSEYFVKGPPRQMPQGSIKQSFTFNGLLKLNKILQYISQVRCETTDVAKLMEDRYSILTQDYIYFKECIEHYKERIRRSKENLELIRAQLKKESDCVSASSSQTSISINDDYGSEYSTFAQDKAKFNLLQARKLKQSIDIIDHLKIPDFIDLGRSKVEDNAFYIDFKFVDFENILASPDKELLNCKLGYYLLIMKIITQKILFIPLPHALSFMGSNSLVDGELPFYALTKANQQHNSKLKMATARFNINVNQLRQYMEHHR